MTERKSFTVTWRIKKFSFCWHRGEEELSSPSFFIEGLQESKWALYLFPRATRSKQNGTIAIYLQHNRDESSSHELEIDFELSVLDFDGLPIKVVSFTNCTMQENDWSAPLLLKQYEVFQEKSDIFLPKDSLTVRCRIWNISQKNINSERYLAVTRIEVEKASLFGVVKKNDWRGNGYNVNFISSSSEVFPILLNVQIMDDGPYAEIKPYSGSGATMKFCKCKLHFTGDENVIVYGKSEFIFSFDEIPLYTDATSWFIPLTYISNYNVTQPLFEMENLNLQCEIEYSFGIVSEKIKKIDYAINMFQNGCSIKEKRQENIPNLKDDLLSLMFNGYYSDIKLLTENKTFSVHRNILSARSLFFRNKFADKSYKESTIYIEDLDDEILHQVLVFLYTDTIQNMEIENAMNLYSASSKYEIPSLKQKCSSFLQNNLDSSICCDVLKLADKYQDSDLKKTVQYYILEHEDEVLASEKWEALEFFPELKEELISLKRMKK